MSFVLGILSSIAYDRFYVGPSGADTIAIATIYQISRVEALASQIGDRRARESDYDDLLPLIGDQRVILETGDNLLPEAKPCFRSLIERTEIFAYGEFPPARTDDGQVEPLQVLLNQGQALVSAIEGWQADHQSVWCLIGWSCQNGYKDVFSSCG